MRHADGHWIWIRARAEVVADADDEPHLVGIAVDVTEQRRLAEASRTADLRLRDAIEAISEAFVLWDSANRLVSATASTSSSTAFPTSSCSPARPMPRSPGAAAGRSSPSSFPIADDGVGARSVEARVEDGRWLQINERRTEGRRLRLGRHRHHRAEAARKRSSWRTSAR